MVLNAATWPETRIIMASNAVDQRDQSARQTSKACPTFEAQYGLRRSQCCASGQLHDGIADIEIATSMQAVMPHVIQNCKKSNEFLPL